MKRPPMRPALRYYGGKWRLADWVTLHFPPHRIYVEPYGGAASVLIRKRRTHGEVYNDLDGEVVNVFRVLRDPELASSLAASLRLTPYSRAEWRTAYEPTDDPVERARRAICRSQMGFGSDSINPDRRTGFRSNANRSGTNPATDWARWPEQVMLLVERFRGVIIEQKEALEVIADHDGPETLHYVDPPYEQSTRNFRPNNYAHDMDEERHRRLASTLKVLRGHVVLSGYRCPLYDELYGEWERFDKEVVVFRQRRRTESLWLSPRAAACLSNRLF